MGKSNERNEEEVKNKSILLKELSNEAVEAAKYKEENNGWYWGDRKHNRTRFKRLRLMIEEILKDIERE